MAQSLIQAARKTRYMRLEGFLSEPVRFELPREIATRIRRRARRLAKQAGVSVEDAESTLFNIVLEAHAKRVLPGLLEHMDGGGI